MHDVLGNVHGLQFILSKSGHAGRIERNGKRDKEFWPPGLAKKGHFFLIGSPKDILLICEGYATAATLHEATGHPVAVAFDAGNLLPASQALRSRYPRVRFLLCADDDYLTDGNTGISAASAVAAAVSHTSWVVPRFLSDRGGKKLTDFNDLHSLDGMLTVRTQIEDKVRELGWEREKPRADPQGGKGRAFAFDLDDILRDFSLIYGTNTVFDDVRKKIIELGPFGAAAGRPLVRNWLEHPDRQVVLPEQVGFDPSEQDESITCNLWGGWPTKPGGNGSCDMLLELLAYLTSGEEGTVKNGAGEDVSRSDELYRWIIKWLAYPIQYPGAKMQTSVLVHGPEGTGKNTFFAAVRKIYGKYGTQFGQTELDSQFNGWASGKLFAIGNEVVSRAELYHVQGKLKNWVTEPEWQINEKMLPTRAEQNHCNFVFFSNRIDIAKLDNGDRRYCVVWTPLARSADFYRQVGAEIAAGGVEALHEYLMNIDLTGFDVHAKPPHTAAKDELIELGMDSTERFFRDWIAGEISGVPAVPCKSDDLYDFYRAWATREGISRAAQKQTLLTAVGKKEGVEKRKTRWRNGVDKQGMVVFPPGQWEDTGGRTTKDYLGSLISDFSSAVSAYRGDLA
jgi:putative DNA primase/helicase